MMWLIWSKFILYTYRSGSIVITGEVILKGTGDDAGLISTNTPTVLQLVSGIDSVISQGVGIPASE